MCIVFVVVVAHSYVELAAPEDDPLGSKHVVLLKN
jgi:hypothetical protein